MHFGERGSRTGRGLEWRYESHCFVNEVAVYLGSHVLLEVEKFSPCAFGDLSERSSLSGLSKTATGH